MKDGGGIYGKGGSPPFHWMSGVFWRRHGTWLNPVRAGDPGAYLHGAAHISGGGDDLVKVKRRLERVGMKLEEVLGRFL